MSPDLLRSEQYVHIQGFVTLLPTSEITGGNVVVPRSHKIFEKMAIDGADSAAIQEVTQSHDALSGGVTTHLEAGDLFICTRSVSAPLSGWDASR